MAIYYPEHNLVFIHIPKNAGTSVKLWSHAHSPTSINILEKHEHFGRTYNQLVLSSYNVKDLKSFIIIRNPWDRMVSCWAFYLKRGMIELNTTFEDFVKRKAKLKPGVGEHHRGWGAVETQQYRFNMIPDIVLRFENLTEDFKIIQDILGCHVPLEKSNISSHIRYREYYHKQLLIDIVADHFVIDIQRYGYTF